MRSRAAIAFAVVVAGILLYALVFRPPTKKDAGIFPVPVSGPARSLASPLVPDAAADRWAEKTLAGLSLEKKIGQLLCVEIAGGYIADDDPRLARWIGYARDLGVGGMVLYGGTPRDVAHLLNRLQREAAIPILMAADFEGGPGQQVAGASEFPGDMAFAAAGSEELMYEAAKIAGIEGRAMGIHLTYSPVADVSVRPENPAESVRSFGGDLDLLGRMMKAYVKGYLDGGMLTTAKHFPGRGDVAAMPGFPGFSWIDKPAERIEAEEFRAFKQAVDAGVAFVMTEHIAAPAAAGGSDLPASQEGRLVTGWLREKLGFKGVVTTDDLWYDQVVKRFGETDVAVKAFLAGHDVLLKPKDAAATLGRMVEAVRGGEIAESRIDASVLKLLSLKARLGLPEGRFVDEARVGEYVGTPAHLAVVQEVADRSLTLLKNEGVLPVAAAKRSKIVNISIQKAADGDPSPAALAAKLAAAFPGTTSFAFKPEMDAAAYDRAWKAVEAADLVVLSLFVPRNRLGDPAPLRDADLAFIRRAAAAKPGAVVAMSYGNPHLVRRLEAVPAFLVGYGERGWFGNQAVYFESFVKVLRGELKPAGRLPVKVGDAYPIGAGL